MSWLPALRGSICLCKACPCACCADPDWPVLDPERVCVSLHLQVCVSRACEIASGEIWRMSLLGRLGEISCSRTRRCCGYASAVPRLRTHASHCTGRHAEVSPTMGSEWLMLFCARLTVYAQARCPMHSSLCVGRRNDLASGREAAAAGRTDCQRASVHAFPATRRTLVHLDSCLL